MPSSEKKRRFPAPWATVKVSSECYQVQDANGVTLAWIFCRDDETRFSVGASKLTSDEARRLANGIARLPEFMAQRRGFYERGTGKRWNPKKPYHVALEDNYVREHWSGIDTICKLNSIPFNATGEKIQQDGTWCVYEFAWQMDAILFWHRFQGRWLRGDEFHYPEVPQDLPPLRDLPRHPYDKRRPER
jgi:hypothetical protein